MTDFASLAIQIDSRQADEAGRSLDRLTQTGARTEQALTRVTASAGQQRAGMQQLSYQIGDVAQQFALGTNPMIIFAQQGGQVVQALNLMRGSAGGLIGFLGGPWGAVIMGAATVVGMLGSKLMEGADAADKLDVVSYSLGDTQKMLQGVFDTTTGKMINQTGAAIALARAQLMLARATAQKNIAESQGALSDTTQKQTMVTHTDPNAWFGGVGITRAMPISGTVIGPYLANPTGANAVTALKGIQALADAGKITTARLIELTTQINNNVASTKILADTDAGLASLNSGKLAPSLQNVTVAHIAKAHASRGVSDATKELNAAIAENIKFEKAQTRAHEEANRELIRRIQLLTETKSLTEGKFGFEQPKPSTVAEQIATDAANMRGPFGDLLSDQDKWNEGLGTALQRLTRIAGVMGGLGALGGATGSAIGTLLSTPVGMTSVGGKDQVVTLGDRIENIFKGKDGQFGKTMGSILQDTGTGLAASSLILGQKGNNPGAAVGGFIGGQIGGLAGPLGKALGSFAGGVLGGLVGSLFASKPHGSGSVSNTGVAVSANNDSISTGMSSFGLGVQQSVSKVADSLGGTVGNYSVGIGRYKDYYQVASTANDPLLGKAHYSRDSSTALYDGLDAQAALRSAIGAAIQQGAIQGVRAGTQTLLKAGSDIEAQLGKALKFEGVFNDLKQATDPIGYQIDTLNKKFTDLRTIFKEAGATAADYADLEKLLAVQRQDAIESGRKAAVAKVADPLNLQIQLLDLIGEKEKSVAASRLMELAGLKDSIQPLQAMVYTLQDAADVIAKFTPLRDDLVKFRDELLGNGGSSSFSFLTSQFRTTALGAANGDATAMANLRGAASDYLDAAKDNARTLQEYNAARAEVLAATDKAIFAADSQIDYQQAVIDTAKSSSLMADTLANLNTLSANLLTTNNEILRLWKRIDGDGFANPIQVEVVA